MTDRPLHCWEFNDCPESLCDECPVFIDKASNCWEYEETRCGQILGFDKDCQKCRYYHAMIGGIPKPTQLDTKDHPEV
ncbi:MAG: hypothetical protein ABIK83_13300 [Candidatus Zixiibacteriota bacterium]